MIYKVITLKTQVKNISMYKNNLIAENKIITTSDSFHVSFPFFAVVMPPYLALPTAEVKIKLLSYFFLIPMAEDD